MSNLPWFYNIFNPKIFENERKESMTREKAINNLYSQRADYLNHDDFFIKEKYDALTMAIKVLEERKEMTVEQYRKRMIEAFHNADCGELAALVVLPTEKEFEHLEWLLKTHWKYNEEQKTGKWISVAEAWMMEELENQIKEGKGCLGRDEE